MTTNVRKAPRRPRQIVHGEWRADRLTAAHKQWAAAGGLTVTPSFWSLGNLRVIITREPQEGWHLSISHPARYPSWDEIAHARYNLLPQDLTFVMFLPPDSQYVNIEGGNSGRAGNVFHLHEYHDAEADAR